MLYPNDELIAKLDTTEKVDAAFAELNQYWDNLLNIFTVKSGNDKLDGMVNIWNQYQCMITFCMSRSASFFESGIRLAVTLHDQAIKTKVHCLLTKWSDQKRTVRLQIRQQMEVQRTGWIHGRRTVRRPQERQ